MSPTPVLADTARFLENPGEQRSRRRYPIALDLEYKSLWKGRVERVGCSKTVNLSSTGVLFEATGPLRVGCPIEILIDWPLLLDGACPMKLVIVGRVVRSDMKLVAVRIKLHEFRTAGTNWWRIRSSRHSLPSLLA